MGRRSWIGIVGGRSAARTKWEVDQWRLSYHRWGDVVVVVEEEEDEEEELSYH